MRESVYGFNGIFNTIWTSYILNQWVGSMFVRLHAVRHITFLSSFDIHSIDFQLVRLALIFLVSFHLSLSALFCKWIELNNSKLGTIFEQSFAALFASNVHAVFLFIIDIWLLVENSFVFWILRRPYSVHWNTNKRPNSIWFEEKENKSQRRIIAHFQIQIKKLWMDYNPLFSRWCVVYYYTNLFGI